MIKKIKYWIRKCLPSETIERYFVAYAMFVKNTKRKVYRKCGSHTQLLGPLQVVPQYMELDDWTRLQADTRVISSGGKVKVMKYAAIAADCLFIPGSHVPTVGLPQFLSITHINDTQGEIVVEEDAWVGSRTTLLGKARVGRGAVVGACSLVNKPIPPYAVAVGSPAHVIAVRFTLDEILRHEQILYPPEERLSVDFLEELFATTYKGLRTIGVSDMSDEDKNLLASARAQYGIPNHEERP